MLTREEILAELAHIQGYFYDRYIEGLFTEESQKIATYLDAYEEIKNLISRATQKEDD